MVTAVMLPPVPQEIVGRTPGMHGIMDHQVSGITGQKSSEEYPPVSSHQEVKAVAEERCYNYRNNRRHDESVLVAREFMMDPVNVILKLKFSRRLCVKMKKEAMDEVLDQGEEQHAGNKQPPKSKKRDGCFVDRITHTGDRGQIVQDDRKQKVRSGESLEE